MKTVIGSETEYAIIVNGHSADYASAIAFALLEKCPFLLFRKNLSKWRRGRDDFQIDTDMMERLLAGPGKMTEEDKSWLGERFSDASEENCRLAVKGEIGVFLANGSRFYVDLGHPEFSIPEVTNARDFVVNDKAGEIIVEESKKKAETPEIKISIYKNNSDGKGVSYACHENYLVSDNLFRALTREKDNYGYRWRSRDSESNESAAQTSDIITAFFVTRQIFCGAGKLGIDIPSECRLRRNFYEFRSGNIDVNDEKIRQRFCFQISQRADFFIHPCSLETTSNRGIINTRDRSYCRDRDLRRFHVIVGDSNMSEWSLFLKSGVTALVLDMLEHKASGSLGGFALKEPVRAIKEVSLDLTCKKNIIELKNGEKVSSLKVQKEFLKAVKAFRGDNLSKCEAEVIAKWEYVLDALENDPSQLDDKIDWRIKKNLFETYLKKYGANWRNFKCFPVMFKGKEQKLGDVLKSMDIEYSNINQEKGIYYLLLKNGKIARIVSDAEIANAVDNPPNDTRAWLRGMFIKHFSNLLEDVSWNFIDCVGIGKIEMDPLDCSKDAVKILKNHIL